MSRKPWWTTLTADNILELRRRVLATIHKEFASSLGADVQDVVQHAFVALLRNRHKIRAREDGLYRYLLVVARRAALDRIKRARHRQGHRRRTTGVADQMTSPAMEAEIRENHERIRKIFRELEELDRLIVWSYVVDERSIRSIAGDLELSWHRVADTIDKVLQEVRRRLME